MSVAHSQNWTGWMVPALLSLSRSCSIFSLRAYGTGLALWKMGVPVGSTCILAFIPCRVPRPFPNSGARFCRISSRRLSCEVSCLILGQFWLIFSSQFLPNRAGPSPGTTKSGREYSCPCHRLSHWSLTKKLLCRFTFPGLAQQT